MPASQNSAASLPLILVGGGGHCQSCIDVIESTGQFEIKAIVDRAENLGRQVSGYDIEYTDCDLPELISQYHNVLVCLGQIKTPEPRKNLFKKLTELGGNFVSPVSPAAHVSPHACLGKGSIVMHYALLNAGVQVGFGCIINSRALLEHGVKTGDFCHVSTGAIINGNSSVGSGCFIGSGAIIAQGINIGQNAIVAAGSIVLTDVPPGCTVYGLWK